MAFVKGPILSLATHRRSCRFSFDFPQNKPGGTPFIIASLAQSRGFLGCGLRRNDGGACPLTPTLSLQGRGGTAYPPDSRFRGSGGIWGTPAFRHCGVGRNPGRSVVGIQDGLCQGADPFPRNSPALLSVLLRFPSEQTGGHAFHHSQPGPVPGFPGLRPPPVLVLTLN